MRIACSDNVHLYPVHGFDVWLWTDEEWVCPRVKAVILDNGLTSFGAHHFHVDLAVASAFRERGIGCEIFAARTAQRETLKTLSATPHFTRTLYDSVRLPHLIQITEFLKHKLAGLPGQAVCNDSLSERLTYARLNRAYAKDLARLPEYWQRDTLLLIPAISQNQIGGLVRYLLSLPTGRRPTTICQLMFQPEWTPWGARAMHGAGFYRNAFTIAHRLIGRSLFFIAETKLLAEEYRQRFSLPITALPLPLPLNDVTVTTNPSQSPPLFAYLGYAKTERGFHLLSAAIKALAATGYASRFLVQVQHSGWERDVIAAEQELRHLPNVEIVEGELSRNSYLNCLRRADAILLPYDPDRYGARGSAVLIEAAAAGCPVVASDHGWPAQSIRQGDIAGEIMASFDAPSLAGAITRLLQHFADITRKARDCVPTVVARHDSGRFVDALLNIAQQTGETAGAVAR